MGTKLHYGGQQTDGQKLYFFHCPGCKAAHRYHVPHWQFNEDFEKPTFRPSLLCNHHDPASRCHLFLTDGKIEFLQDCHHELKGKTVEIPDWYSYE